MLISFFFYWIATVGMIFNTMILFIDNLILSGGEDIVYVSKYLCWLSAVRSQIVELSIKLN